MTPARERAGGQKKVEPYAVWAARIDSSVEKMVRKIQREAPKNGALNRAASGRSFISDTFTMEEVHLAQLALLYVQCLEMERRPGTASLSALEELRAMTPRLRHMLFDTEDVLNSARTKLCDEARRAGVY
jgi:hypothetical protein